MSYLFTSESVSEGHPDKVADQISDAILDQFMAEDAESKVAVETLVTTGQVVLSGEVKSKAYVDVQSIARKVIARIGYTKSEYGFEANSCGILSCIQEQSPDINRGVDRNNKEEQGAGDQGMMFGYASNENANYMPLPIDLAHCILFVLSEIRKNEIELMPYLRPDSKSQVTIEYNEQHQPLRIDSIVISTQHDEFIKAKNESPEAALEADKEMQEQIKKDIAEIVLPRVKNYYKQEIQELFGDDMRLLVNPTGRFVIGGPYGDTGLTGRKIIVDTYGGRASHGGGAFSGKDPSKVDRSAAYAARHMAKNLVAAGVADRMLIQLAYAIGVAEPMSIFVNTYGTAQVALSDGEIAKRVGKLFDLRPYAIEKRLGLRKPIYEETAKYGHFGRDVRKVKKSFTSYDGVSIEHELELYTWEKLDCVDLVKEAFGL